ncbi:MAG: hypothetical protein R3F59_33620 [Myxococcota bacterium]
MLVLDERGTIEMANPAACALFRAAGRAAPRRPLGLPASDADIEIYGAGRDRAGRTCAASTTWRGEVRYVAWLRDVTEQRRAEQAYAATQNRLACSSSSSLLLWSFDDGGKLQAVIGKAPGALFVRTEPGIPLEEATGTPR